MLVKFGNWIFHNRNILFPLFYAALFIPSPDILSLEWALSLGGIFIAAGILIRSITIGLEYIVRGGFKRKIYATNLVTGGIYSLCRNPMYLGNILLILGFGIFANSLIFILIFFPVFLFLYFAIISAEEAFLSKKFGEEYEAYKSKVKALIPDLIQIESAFKGYQFNWKQVLKKEYNSLFLYISGIEILLYYNEQIGDLTLLINMGIIVVLYGTVKYLKNNEYLD